MNPNPPNRQNVVVRQLRPDDIKAVIALDARHTGRRREDYLRLKVAQAFNDTGIQVSLAAEADDALVGFLLSRVYYGEFGAVEPVAVLDTLGVDPEFRSQGVGRALLRQLRVNLQSLHVPTLQTEVSWEDQGLLAFFHRVGFKPTARLCLDLRLDEARLREETAEARLLE